MGGFFLPDKMVKLVVGGSVINGPTPSSFYGYTEKLHILEDDFLDFERHNYSCLKCMFQLKSLNQQTIDKVRENLHISHWKF